MCAWVCSRALHRWLVDASSIDIWTEMIEPPVMAFDIIRFSLALSSLADCLILSISAPDSRIVHTWISIWFGHKSCECRFMSNHFAFFWFSKQPIYAWPELVCVNRDCVRCGRRCMLYVIDCIFPHSLIAILSIWFVFINRKLIFLILIYCSL